MKELVLNFPAFYHCAIKDNCPLRQYDIVNILFRGTWRQANAYGEDISEAAASSYVNGGKAISKQLLLNLIQCDREEIVRRFVMLGLYDVSNVVVILKRLIEEASLSEFVKSSLLKKAEDASEPYQFVADVFLSAVKCPFEKSQKLTEKEKKVFLSFRATVHLDESMNTKEQAGGEHGERESEKDFAEEENVQQSGSRLDELDYSLDVPSIEHIDYLEGPGAVQIKYRSIHYIDEIESVISHFAPFLFEGSDPKVVISLDQSDIYTLFALGEKCEYTLMDLSGEKKEVIQAMQRMGPWGTCDAALIAIEAPEDVSLEDINEILDIMNCMCSPDCNLIFGASLIEEKTDNRYCMHMLLRLQ